MLQSRMRPMKAVAVASSVASAMALVSHNGTCVTVPAAAESRHIRQPQHGTEHCTTLSGVSWSSFAWRCAALHVLCIVSSFYIAQQHACDTNACWHAGCWCPITYACIGRTRSPNTTAFAATALPSTCVACARETQASSATLHAGLHTQTTHTYTCVCIARECSRRCVQRGWQCNSSINLSQCYLERHNKPIATASIPLSVHSLYSASGVPHALAWLAANPKAANRDNDIHLTRRKNTASTHHITTSRQLPGEAHVLLCYTSYITHQLTAAVQMKITQTTRCREPRVTNHLSRTLQHACMPVPAACMPAPALQRVSIEV